MKRGKESGLIPKAASTSRSREELQQHWLRLTRETLPALATARAWPVRHDHCFQRILLDNACGGRWYDHVAGRPAYAHASDAVLAEAVRLGEACAAGEVELAELNRRSLGWRAQSRAGAKRGI